MERKRFEIHNEIRSGDTADKGIKRGQVASFESDRSNIAIKSSMPFFERDPGDV